MTMKHHGLIIALVTMTKLDDPNHLSRHTAIHETETQGISLHKHE
jgi:hypothetical protein